MASYYDKFTPAVCRSITNKYHLSWPTFKIGDEPQMWIMIAEQFFDCYKVSDPSKVYLAYYYVEKVALELMKVGTVLNMKWEEFTSVLYDEFRQKKYGFNIDQFEEHRRIYISNLDKMGVIESEFSEGQRQVEEEEKTSKESFLIHEENLEVLKSNGTEKKGVSQSGGEEFELTTTEFRSLATPTVSLLPHASQTDASPPSFASPSVSPSNSSEPPPISLSISTKSRPLPVEHSMSVTGHKKTIENSVGISSDALNLLDSMPTPPAIFHNQHSPQINLPLPRSLPQPLPILDSPPLIPPAQPPDLSHGHAIIAPSPQVTSHSLSSLKPQPKLSHSICQLKIEFPLLSSSNFRDELRFKWPCKVMIIPAHNSSTLATCFGMGRVSLVDSYLQIPVMYCANEQGTLKLQVWDPGAHSTTLQASLDEVYTTLVYHVMWNCYGDPFVVSCSKHVVQIYSYHGAHVGIVHDITHKMFDEVYEWCYESNYGLDIRFVERVVVEYVWSMFLRQQVIGSPNTSSLQMVKKYLICGRAVIFGYAGCEWQLETLNFFNEMQVKGIKSGQVIMLCIISACTHLRAPCSVTFSFGPSMKDQFQKQLLVSMTDLWAGQFQGEGNAEEEEIDKYFGLLPVVSAMLMLDGITEQEWCYMKRLKCGGIILSKDTWELCGDLLERNKFEWATMIDTDFMHELSKKYFDPYLYLMEPSTKQNNFLLPEVLSTWVGRISNGFSLHQELLLTLTQIMGVIKIMSARWEVSEIAPEDFHIRIWQIF